MGGGEAGLLGVCRRCCCLDSQPVEPTATGMGGSYTWPGALGPQGTPDTKRRPPQSQESDTQCQPRWPTGCTVNIPEKPCAGASAQQLLEGAQIRAAAMMSETKGLCPSQSRRKTSLILKLSEGFSSLSAWNVLPLLQAFFRSHLLNRGYPDQASSAQCPFPPPASP